VVAAEYIPKALGDQADQVEVQVDSKEEQVSVAQARSAKVTTVDRPLVHALEDLQVVLAVAAQAEAAELVQMHLMQEVMAVQGFQATY
jgi:hypothetical protein